MQQMSNVIEAAVKALNEKMGDDGFDGVAKFVIEGEGNIIVDSSGARIGDDETEVTLTADADTFESILSGDLDPTAAFMSGRLSVDGDMGLAMKLGSILA
jgi:putative sterol carrier protein